MAGYICQLVNRLIKRHLIVDRSITFVDYGAGLGRMTILAAMLPFRRTIGVELDQSLVSRARENIERVKGHLNCDARIYTADARQFRIPNAIASIYFNNPFTGSILQGVLDQAATLKSLPQVICNLPERSAFEDEIRAVDWLKPKTNFALSQRRKCLIFAREGES